MSLLTIGGSLAIAYFIRAGGLPGSEVILRSSEDLLSLRHLLRDEGTMRELSSFCDGMALWNVASRSEAAPEGEECLPISLGGGPERIRHDFEFASRKSPSSRIYRLSFLSCKRGDGLYDVTKQVVGFRSSFSKRPEPILTSALALTILEQAVNDPGVSADLVRMLRDMSIKHCSVSELGPDPGEPGMRRFQLTVADGEPGDAGTKAVIRYLALYDGTTGSTLFTRIEDGER